MTVPPPPLGLFEGTGIELEYMIVDRDSLAVKPVADELIRATAGHVEAEIERDGTAWSNELALHVIELKTNGAAPTLRGLADAFQRDIRDITSTLAPMRARLMPTGMHPWMDPRAEFRVWPHEYSPVYEAFNRIFDCRAHGWANVQSMHINLPFADDDQFGRLHAAIRLVLPLVPALAASTPVRDGRANGCLDNRLAAYRIHTAQVPQLTGDVIPEPIFTRGEYEGRLLRGVYDAVAPHDPEGILQFEWVNARGCIARFDRSAIEIRLVDTQECPRADLAVAAAAIAAVRALVEERHADFATQSAFPTGALVSLLDRTIRDADAGVVDQADYMRLFGYADQGACTARDLWRHIVQTSLSGEPEYAEWREPLDRILTEGCLARRIAARLGPPPAADRLRAVYRELCDCLETGRLFPSAPPDDGAGA